MDHARPQLNPDQPPPQDGALREQQFRLEAEAARQKLENLLASISDAFITLDRHWRYTFVNDQAERMLGKSRDELLGQCIWELFPEAVGTSFYHGAHQAMREQRVVHVEDHSSGLDVWFDNRLYPSPDGLTILAADITERKRIETELRQRIQEMETLMDVLPISVFFAHDRECRRITGNRASYELMRMPPGSNISRSAPREERPTHFRVCRDGRELAPGELPIQYAAAHGAPVRGVELDLEYDDGSVVNLFGYASPIMDEAGRPRGAVGAFVDITAHKQAEEAQRRYELLAENSRDIILFIRREDGSILDANAAAVAAYGYSREELLALKVSDLRTPGAVEQVRDQMAQADKGGISFETEHRRKDGVVFPVGVSSRGAVLGGERLLVSIIRDITARKRAEGYQALMAEVLRTLNKGGGDLHDAVAETLRAIKAGTGFDAIGLRLRWDDDSPYYEQHGFSDDFLRVENFLCARGKDGAALFDDEGRPVLECTCGLVLSGRTDPSMPCFTEGGSFWTNNSPELLALPPKADPRISPRNRCIHDGYQSVALIPVRSDGVIIGLLQLNDRRPDRYTPESIRFFESLADNIGLAIMRKQAEEALRQANEQLREADRRKDEFLAMLAHELRNPLAPVRNAIQVLRLAGDRTEVRNRQQDTIERQIGHMARLLDDLLDVSRVTRGKIELRRRPRHLTDVLAHAVETAMPLIGSRRHTLHFEPSADDLRVEADFDRLAQIVGNLLVNAAKYTDAGGQIWLEAGREGDAAVIRVRDTGLGIAPEMRPHIFELFAQAERSLDRAQGGLGIGLTMVKSLVQLHGGEVEARSEGLGRGSEFIVRLPALAPVAGFEPAASAQAAASEGALARRILVVDDNADSAASLAELLALWGHDVRAAYSGKAALDEARAFRPEWVLLDIGMPGMDGYEVARRLRAEHGPGMMLAAMTGYGQDQDRNMTREADFNDHLVKPVDLKTLQELLANRLAGSNPEG